MCVFQVCRHVLYVIVCLAEQTLLIIVHLRRDSITGNNSCISLFVCARIAEMEIIPEGKNFRLVQDHELPEIMAVLEQYMPEALKVSCVPASIDLAFGGCVTYISVLLSACAVLHISIGCFRALEKPCAYWPYLHRI